MDEVSELLGELARLGVRLSAEGDRLQVSAARGVLTEELRHRLARDKLEILRRLSAAGAETGAEGAALVPDPAGDRKPFPLSDLQLGFFVADDPHMELHVRPHLYMEFDGGALDPAAYQAAWNRALARHRREICVVGPDGDLRLVDGVPELRCRVHDLRDRPADEVADHLRWVREATGRRELPLDRWPWLDLAVTLWREEGAERSRIHYNHNSFFSDGFGTNQLLAEVEEYSRDPSATRPPIELSYRDAVLALEALAASEEGARAEAYWLERLPTLPPPPPLPLRAGVERRRRSRLSRRAGELAPAEMAAFKRHAAARGLTPSNAMLAAYARVLARWSGRERFILSQMVTRRFPELHPELAFLIGNFASLYPLEVRVDTHLPFARDAALLQAQVLEDVRHLQFGGMRVLQELNRLHGAFGAAPSPYVVGSGLFTTDYRKADHSLLETPQTMLDHQFFELADGRCHYVWDLVEELFPEGLIDAMWSAYGRLLRRLADDPVAWERADLELLPADVVEARRRDERRVERPPGARLHDGFRARAAAAPERPAVVSRGVATSYGELATAVDRLRHDLAGHGVRPGDRVPVVMDRTPETAVAILALSELGAAYVPFDPRAPGSRLRTMLAGLGAHAALTQERHLDAVDWPEGVIPRAVDRMEEAEGQGAEAPLPLPAADPTDLAYVIYTSGSTGRPKGVMIDHRAVANTLADLEERFEVGPEDVVFGVSALTFDLSVWDLFGTFSAGATLVYPDPDTALDAGHWVDLLASEGVTIWSSVPALASLWAEVAERRGIELPALRLVMLSGDKVPLVLPDAVRRVAPSARVVSLGGATEASIWSILFPVDAVDPGWRTVPYGHPMVNQPWEVLDRHGRPCPTWVPGELCIGGLGLAQGYWRDAAKTAAAFVPAGGGGRLYRTGDLGRYRPEGWLEWMGRVDFQLKVRGMRIEPGEVEAALAEHPAVACSVVALREPPGGGAARLVGFVRPAEGGEVDGRALEAFLEERLPVYMVPRAWQAIDAVPLTTNGKVDRAALREEEGGAEAPERPEHVEPEGPVETHLREIWQRVLDRSPIGVLDDFFELGGQSFDAIRIFTRVHEELGVAFTLGDLWNARTVRGLARRIADREGGDGVETGCVVPIDLSGRGEPLFLVHPAGGSVMGYSRLGRRLGRPLYGIQAPQRGAPVALRRDVPALARHYLAELRRVRPHGPYALGGWSSGAMIAFEIAAQLEAAGETVSGLYLLDGPVPVDHGDPGDTELVRWFLDDLAIGLPVERLEGVDLGGLEPVEQLRAAVARLGPEAAPDLDPEHLAPSYETFRDVLAAGGRYRPPAVRADLTVLRVEEDVVEEFASHPHRHDDDWGWGEHARGSVRCVRVPGTHHTFLTEPRVARWCSLLEAEG
jgi:pyochelin synthetase